MAYVGAGEFIGLNFSSQTIETMETYFATSPDHRTDEGERLPPFGSTLTDIVENAVSSEKDTICGNDASADTLNTPRLVGLLSAIAHS